VNADGKKSVSEGQDKTHSHVSPPVQQADGKFFGKDYPWDKRPKVDVFHFKHPYPAVQDSNDFDSDYVKDENSDDGSWHAQSEYDRLRHKLAKEKADVAKALAAKEKAEKELQDAMKREKVVVKKVAPKPKTPEVESSQGATTEHTRVEKAPATPGGIASPGDVKVATSDTKKAMDALEECKKQLAEARENLKKLMKELEEAKKRQRETEEALDEALSREKELEGGQKTLGKSVKSEYQEYMDAREAYLKQQALLAKMENDIEVAAEKVKSFRDGEDANGGVYNTEPSRSGAQSFALPVFACILVVFTTSLGH